MIVNEFLPDLSLAKNSREDSDDGQESHSALKRTEGLGFKRKTRPFFSARDEVEDDDRQRYRCRCLCALDHSLL